MTDDQRILVAPSVPPMILPRLGAPRRQRDNPLPRLGRLAWLLAAFSLPVLGLTVANLVHRAVDPEATQAAAPPSPLVGAAVSSDAIPAIRLGMASPHRPNRALRG